VTGSQLVCFTDFDELMERSPILLMSKVERKLLYHQLSLEQIDRVLTLSLGNTVDGYSKFIHGEGSLSYLLIKFIHDSINLLLQVVNLILLRFLLLSRLSVNKCLQISGVLEGQA
jgi:hypothetical protein